MDESTILLLSIGTTVLGAFDPLDPIADICEKYNCWFHIDVRQFDVKIDRIEINTCLFQ